MVQIPEDFSTALAKAGLADFFTGCTGPHQNEYLMWITGAKQQETRTVRIAKAVEMLSAKWAQEKAHAKKHRLRQKFR